VKPPGWSHDGSTQTARVLQREWKQQHQGSGSSKSNAA